MAAARPCLIGLLLWALGGCHAWAVSPPSQRGFHVADDSGWTVQMRRCDQQALPDGWRDIDLDEAIAQ